MTDYFDFEYESLSPYERIKGNIDDRKEAVREKAESCEFDVMLDCYAELHDISHDINNAELSGAEKLVLRNEWRDAVVNVRENIDNWLESGACVIR